jgi:hypothetical protein
VGQRQAPLGHHPDQVAQAELEAQVPSHAQNADFAIKVTTCEQILPTFASAHTDPSIRPALKLTGSATAICTGTTKSTIRPASLDYVCI